jgi:hypothetical protein
MPAPVAVPLDKIVQGLLRLLARMLREKAHGQIVITIRDGQIQMVTETKQHLPTNLPEA